MSGVQQVWPGCIIQWEDFKGPNALRILDHFRDEVPSFNDDVQGTAAVVLAGLYTTARALERDLADLRFVLAGSGAAGIGIVRLLHRALAEEGIEPGGGRLADRRARLARPGPRRPLGPRRVQARVRHERGGRRVAWSLTLEGDDHQHLAEVIRAMRPDVLIGTTGQLGSFDEGGRPGHGGGRRAARRLRPVQPLEPGRGDSRRTSWPGARAAPSSPPAAPSASLTWEGRERLVGQANNVFIFPGVGLGAVVAEVRTHHGAHVPGGRPGAGGAGQRRAPRGRRALPAGGGAGRHLPRGGHWPWPRRPWRPGWPASARGPTWPPPSTRPCGTPPTCPTSALAPRSTARAPNGRRSGRPPSSTRPELPAGGGRGRSSRSTAPAAPRRPLSP